MDLDRLEMELKNIVGKQPGIDFIFDLLLAYGQPKASITRLKKGDYNLAENRGELLWKKKVFFKHIKSGDLHYAIDASQRGRSITKHHPRFIILTDFVTLLAVDTKTKDSLDVPFRDLPKHYDFFLPWAGLEKSDLRSENPADIKAAEKMGRLYELILQLNPVTTEEERHALNVFLARLLFCFFAEDTNIFEDDQFTNAIASHTADDGSDLQPYLERLFRVLNTADRSVFPSFLQAFPYVNGGLFAEDLQVPRFNSRSRKLIIESGSLNWKAINPDIFGSMIQAVVSTEDRSTLGLHYTSVVNIMKVLDPLFLDDYRVELEKAGNSEKKLKAFLQRIYNTRVFDPACGCGNFLIIAYKELAKLEIEAFERLYGRQLSFEYNSQLTIAQFFGIEIDDFAHETAKVSLWLAEHQMNVAFEDVFGHTRPTLPLQDGGNIVCGNATRLDWGDVCPKNTACQTYVVGNPPYLGARNQSATQKSDMEHVFEGHKDYKDSDYVCCWFLKAASYIKGTSAEFAFVATNSISQGEVVGYLWPRVLKTAEISFAHQSFKWTNSARGNAGVICVVIGIRERSATGRPKRLFSENTVRIVPNISPYLVPGSDTVVLRTRTAISERPKMVLGSMPRDGGNLILSPDEATALENSHPEITDLVRYFYGGVEFLKSRPRRCLWITDDRLAAALSVDEIRRRIENVRAFRGSSKAKTTQQYARIPHKFAQRSHKSGTAIIIPSTSSERRDYIPMGFLDSSAVISNAALAIYDAEPLCFAILQSRMHMSWVRMVGGRMKTDYRYATQLCYNTFPWPSLIPKRVVLLEELVFEILDAREKCPELTIAQMYDPDVMPSALIAAHQNLDGAVDRCYRSTGFRDDVHRFQHLLSMYEELNERSGKSDA